MTEIPEHLLARSRKRRQELTGEGGDAPAEAAAAAPAAAAAAPAAPATAALAPIEPAPPEPEEPVKPWVQKQTGRKKMPYWITPVLVFLPIWMFIYWATLEPPTRAAEGPLAIGAEVYAEACASCHGGGGGGGVGPQLSGGEVALTFPDFESHVSWVINGSPESNGTPYGDPARPGGSKVSAGGMAGFGEELSAEELLAVVLYERVQHGEIPLEEIPRLEAAILGLEEGELEIEFEDGATPEDIVALFDSLELEVEEETASE